MSFQNWNQKSRLTGAPIANVPRFAAVMLAFVLMACQHPAKNSVTASSAAAEKLAWQSITLETTPCKGPCPVYQLRMDHTGKVTFDGIAHVAQIGPASAQLNAAQLKVLEAAINAAQIQTLTPVYDQSSCPSFYTDQSGQRFSLVLSPSAQGSTGKNASSKTYVVMRNGGCVNANSPGPGQTKPAGFPAALVALARTMTSLMESQHWLIPAKLTPE